MLAPMIELLQLIWSAFVGLFLSRASREAEVAARRHQLSVLQRQSPKRASFFTLDRLIFIVLFRIFPGIIDALKIVEPETVIRWHRAGFRQFWRWKSRPRRGRPKVSLEIRQLIREISLANPLWGAPRIHGELLKLGIDVGQTSIAKYMVKHRRPPSQGWRTFLRNHASGTVAMDLFVVPTLSFRLLYGLLIMQHDRRRMLSLGVTQHPTSEWIARQLTEALGLGAGAKISHPQPRRCLWRRLQAASSGYGNSRSTNRSTFAVAERTMRTFDRLDPTRMP